MVTHYMPAASNYVLAFYQPLNLEQYDAVRNMASDIHAYAPDARILTTYYCGVYSLYLVQK